MSTASRYTGLIEHYRDRLPVSAATRVISLGEGGDTRAEGVQAVDLGPGHDHVLHVVDGPGAENEIIH